MKMKVNVLIAVSIAVIIMLAFTSEDNKTEDPSDARIQ